ncbi:MAG: Acyl-CoA dehydrogenase [Labilithrix sp.]|nr:Acyl-CoA dehydrogenase [Labilithrix sp.]
MHGGLVEGGHRLNYARPRVDVLQHLLTAPLARDVPEDVPGAIVSNAAEPIDLALAGGLASDRLAHAFTNGYRAALARLVRDVPGRPFPWRLSFAHTEKAGGHPRAILTTLTPRDDGSLVLHGTKTFATLASRADELLVVASRGANAAGQNDLAVVRVAAGAPGVTLEDKRALPFAPELPHAVVHLVDVVVAPGDVLPGDGYASYVKPFRTIEDVHVVAATAGYLIGAARAHRFEPALVTDLVALAALLRALAERDPSAPATHLALAGALATLRHVLAEVGRAWASAGASEERARWERDQPLLMVADVVRQKRTDAALAALDLR